MDEHEVEVKLPKLGESILSATIVQWFKKVGDSVKLDEPLLEVSTDKVNSEIPSPISGIVKEIHALPDQELEVGAILATLVVESQQSSSVEHLSQKSFQEKIEKNMPSMKGHYTPVVLNMARDMGISLEELEKIPATGSGGRLSKKDLKNYLSQREKKEKALEISGGIQRIKMGTIRKKISEKMVFSFSNVPHATLINEVNITGLLKQIDREKEAFHKKHGFKLSVTSFIAKAIATAAQEFPLVNASIEGKDTILIQPFINLGIAVSVDEGILVPVIQNVGAKSIEEIAKEIAELAKKSRTKQLHPDELQQGTITLTNFGMGKALIGIPIIRHPEVAIIGVGAIEKKVMVVDESTFAIGSMVHLSLTFDHRIIDGMYGCGFLNAMKEHLEKMAF